MIDFEKVNSYLKGKEKRTINKIYRRNKDVPFINRILEKDTLQVQDWEGKGDYATHKLGWAEDDNKALIFPNVQKIGDTLKDFTQSSNRWEGLDNALKNKNVIKSTPEEADLFTKHYKESKYFKRYAKNMFKHQNINNARTK